MRIENGKVFREDGSFVDQTIRIRGERFSAVSNDQDRIDASGCYVFPGFVDLHVHGAGGGDFSDADPDSLKTFAEYEAEHGITSIVPTTMTLPVEKLRKIAVNYNSFTETEKTSTLLGFRMEGPFLSREKCGSQETSALIPPDPALVSEMQELSGNGLSVMDIAPELSGAISLVENMKNEVRFSVGHTMADYACAKTAMEAGANHLTHMYNAMPAFLHREPGPIGAAMDDPSCTVELIGDGVHLHPATIRSTYKMFGADRIILISDSMRATGLPDGTYELGGHEVFTQGRVAKLASGTIAASITNLYDCMITCVRGIGLPLGDVVKTATINPARYLGVSHRVGSIAIGKQADLVIADRETLEIKAVILRGKVLFDHT